MKIALWSVPSFARVSVPVRAAVAGVTALAVTGANAAVDITATVTDLADAKTAALAIGVAVLSICVAIALYKWIRRAL